MSISTNFYLLDNTSKSKREALGLSGDYDVLPFNQIGKIIDKSDKVILYGAENYLEAVNMHAFQYLLENEITFEKIMFIGGNSIKAKRSKFNRSLEFSTDYSTEFFEPYGNLRGLLLIAFHKLYGKDWATKADNISKAAQVVFDDYDLVLREKYNVPDIRAFRHDIDQGTAIEPNGFEEDYSKWQGLKQSYRMATYSVILASNRNIRVYPDAPRAMRKSLATVNYEIISLMGLGYTRRLLTGETEEQVKSICTSRRINLKNGIGTLYTVPESGNIHAENLKLIELVKELYSLNILVHAIHAECIEIAIPKTYNTSKMIDILNEIVNKYGVFESIIYISDFYKQDKKGIKLKNNELKKLESNGKTLDEVFESAKV